MAKTDTVSFQCLEQRVGRVKETIEENKEKIKKMMN